MNRVGNIEHPTTIIRHRMVGCAALDWMLVVGCWMLVVNFPSAEALRYE